MPKYYKDTIEQKRMQTRDMVDDMILREGLTTKESRIQEYCERLERLWTGTVPYEPRDRH